MEPGSGTFVVGLEPDTPINLTKSLPPKAAAVVPVVVVPLVQVVPAVAEVQLPVNAVL